MKPGAFPARRRILVAASPLLLLPAFFVLNAYLVAQGHRVAYNADLVHPYMVLQDLLRSIDAIWWWHHSPALYIYPDWLLALTVMALPVPALAWPLFFAPLILTLNSVAGGALLAVVGIARIVPAIWAVAAAIYATGIAVAVRPGQYAAHDITSVGAPYIHSGAALLTIAAAALLIAQLSGRGGLWLDAILGAGVFAVVFSDIFFVAWFVLPAAILAIAHTWASRSMRGALLAAWVVVCAGAAVALEISLHGIWRDYALMRGVGIDSAAMVWGYVRTAAAADPITLFVLLVSAALMLAAAPLFLRVLGRRRPSPGGMLVIFLGGSAAGAMLGPIAGNILPSPHLSRYFLVLGMLAAVASVFVLLHLVRRRSMEKRVAWIAAGAVIVGGAVLASPAVRALPKLLAPPALQTCLEALGRTAGIGDYWNTKSLMFASGRKIHMVQILPWMERYRWNYSERWFTHRADDDTPVRIDFVLPERLNMHALIHHFGAPARITICAGTEVWVYEQPPRVPR